MKWIGCALAAVSMLIGAPRSCPAAESAPNVFILDPAALQDAKDRLQRGDSALRPALDKLRRDAAPLLAERNFSVADKHVLPPSGDKHDYMSLAPYWWPDPTRKNGLPYVRRDGEINPERDRASDRKSLEHLTSGVATLSLAYFFTGAEEYAARAASLLRAWFIDEKTRMTPHLRFAQAIPGRNTGRGAGIIETHNLPVVVDAVALLGGSKAWSATDRRALQGWFENYRRWLLESEEGRSEAKARNNHGSWYDVQVAAFSLFVGNKEFAQNLLGGFAENRVAKQIRPDGRQPFELERAQSWTYSLFNLEAMFAAASIGDKLGLDLWTDPNTDKPSIRKALDWLLLFADGKKSWGHRQSTPWQPEKLAPFLRRAALRFQDASYEEQLSNLRETAPDQRMHLLFPKPLSGKKSDSFPSQ